jgi:geranylgeranyl pyrophosphate synthase
MDKYKSFEKTKYKAKQYAEEAKRAIKFLPASCYKESLTNLLLYSLERKI